MHFLGSPLPRGAADGKVSARGTPARLGAGVLGVVLARTDPGPPPPGAFRYSAPSRVWGGGRSPGRAPGWLGGSNVPCLLPTQASFEVSAEARSCPGRHAEHAFTLRPVGFRDSLEVGVTYSCECGCSARLEADSARCSGNGTYVCGLCECNPGHLGTRCECQEGESQSGYQNLCREAEGKPLCSGRGECSCNQCSCFESEFGKIYGSFCQCDNFSCARNKGVLCSGRHPASMLVLGQARAPLWQPPPRGCLVLTNGCPPGRRRGQALPTTGPGGWGGGRTRVWNTTAEGPAPCLWTPRVTGVCGVIQDLLAQHS